MIKQLIVTSKNMNRTPINSFRNLSEFNKALDDIRTSLETNKQQTEGLIKSLAAIKTIRLGDENPDDLFIDDGTKGGGKKSTNIPKLKKFSIQNQKKIESNFQLMDNLVENLDKLDQMEAELLYGNLSVGLKGQALYRKTIADMKTLRKQVAVEQKAVREIIEKIASDHIPEVVKTMTEGTFASVLKALKGSYEKSTKSVLVDTIANQDKAVIRYTSYLQLLSFTDDSGYDHEKYYITLTTEITPSGTEGGNVTYKVNTMSTYRMPGKFNAGETVANKQKAVELIKDILTTEGFLDLVKEIPFPMAQRDVNKKNFGNLATRIKLEDSKLSLLLNPSIKSEEQLHEVMPTVLLAVKGLVLGKTKGELKYKTARDRETKQWIVRFFYRRPQGDEIVLDKPALDRLQRDLDLDDYTIKRIQQVIR